MTWDGVTESTGQRGAPGRLRGNWISERQMSPYYRKLREAWGDDLLLIPAVAAVIHGDEQELLLVRNRDGLWNLPAGAVEPGESPVEAIRREVREETGFICESATLAAVCGGEGFRYTYPNSHEVECVVIVYQCVVGASGPVQDVDEIVETRFFSREDCPDLPLPYDMDLLFPNGAG